MKRTNIINQDIIDEILDKISTNGMDSLTDDELFILKNKGELPPSMIGQLRIKKEWYKRQNVSFFLEDIREIELDIKSKSSFVADLAEYISENMISYDIIGILKINNIEYKGTIYVSLDIEKYKQNKMDFYWDTDFKINLNDLSILQLSKNKKELNDIIREILEKYIYCEF